MMDTRELILKTIGEMVEQGAKMSIFAVAERCGISHSLIYNRYPRLKDKINKIKKKQQAMANAESDAEAIANLMAKNQKLQAKINAEDPTRYEAAIAGLIAHLHEVYAMYDQLRDDRDKLAERLRKRR